MAQRLTQQRQIYYGVESTEGVEVLGTNTEAILVTNLTLNADRAFHQRAMLGALGSYTGKIGAQGDPGLSFTVELRGAGSGALPPEIDELLKTVFGTRTLDNPNSGNGRTINGTSSNVSLVVSDTTGYTVGNAVAVETDAGTGIYEVGWISSLDATHIGLSDALTNAVSLNTGSNIRPSLTFKPADSGHQSLSFQVWLDSTNRISFVGCKGTVKIDMPAPGAIPTATFNFKAISWSHVGGGTRPPSPSYDSTTPPTSSVLKIDANKLDVKMVSWDLGQNVARKMSQNSTYGTSSMLVSNRDLKGSIQPYDVANASPPYEPQFDGWINGTPFALAQQFGNTRYNTMAYQMKKAQRLKVGYGDDNGLTTNQVDFMGAITSGADEVRFAYM